MKGYILDSDTWIEYFRHRGGVDKHIAETPADEIFASEVSIAELTYGALHSKAVERHLQEPKEIAETFTVLPLGDWTHDYAEIRQALTSRGIDTSAVYDGKAISFAHPVRYDLPNNKLIAIG